MDLIVEDGTGVEGANSYATVADGDDYHRAHLYNSAWFQGVSDEKKATALMMATRVIDTHMQFSGYKNSSGNALEWPRALVRNSDVFWAEGVLPSLANYFSNGTYYPTNAIPGRLKEATCELARTLLEADRTRDNAAKGVRSVSVGQGAVSIEFSGDLSDRPGVFTETVRAMLQPFGCLRIGRTRGRVRRG